MSTGAVSAISFGSFGQLNQPSGLGFDAANDLYVLDGYNQRVLAVPVSYTGTVPSFDSRRHHPAGARLERSYIGTGHSTPIWWYGKEDSTSLSQTSGINLQAGRPVLCRCLRSSLEHVRRRQFRLGFCDWVDVGNEEITSWHLPKRATSRAVLPSPYSGCGSAGNTLEPGIVPNCTNTITYNGSGTADQTATFTLDGNASLDGSALGNEILVSGTPEVPGRHVERRGLQGSTFGTVTLTNTGFLPLNLTAINATSSSAVLPLPAGPARPLPACQENRSCTVTFTFGNEYLDDQPSLLLTTTRA